MKKISISTCFDYGIPIEGQLSMIQQAGFTHVSIGGKYEHSSILDERRLWSLKDMLTRNELSVDTIHGYQMDKADTIDVNGKVVRAAGVLGAPVVVLHCSGFGFKAETYESRKKDLLDKLPLFEAMAERGKIRFAFENVLPGIATDLVEYMLGAANPQYFGFCYDSAHDQIDGPRPFDLLERLADRLIAVHISDRIKELVDHVTPGEGFIHFDEMISLLLRANMEFPFLLEVMTTHSKYRDPHEFLAATNQKAIELYDQIY